MLITYLQVVIQNKIHKKHHFHNKKNTKKKLKGQSKVVKYSFTGNNTVALSIGLLLCLPE